MVLLTIHHWSDQEKGVMEMRCVTQGKMVFLTYDPSFRGVWLADYFLELVTLDEGQMPKMTDYEQWLGSVYISTVPIPHDCTDGFLSAYWRRPVAYLEDQIRAAMSSFWALGGVSDGLKKLEGDLKSGAWAQRYSHLINLKEHDCGYHLVTAK